MVAVRSRSNWRIVWYPIAAIAGLSVVYQGLVLWHQAPLIRHAQPDLLLLAAVIQVAAYVVVVPAMQSFFAAAGIRLSGWGAFGLVSTGLAAAKIIPAGEYVVWRTALRRYRGGVSATTQWQILYYIWMVAGLVFLLVVTEITTLLLFPNAHAKTLVGNLRFLPVVASLFLLGLVLIGRSQWVQQTFHKLAFDKLAASKAVSPLGIIRERKLSHEVLANLTFASLATWVLEGLTLYLCLYSLGQYVPVPIALFGFAFARLFSFLPLIPGGLGEIEAGTALFLAAYGYPVMPVVAATVLYRLITYWPPLAVGLTSYVLLSRRRSARGSHLHDKMQVAAAE